MRNYLLEDIYEEDLAKIVDALKEVGFSGLSMIFYLPFPKNFCRMSRKNI